MFVVLDACKIIFVKLNNEEMFLSFNDSHLLIWTNVLRDTVDSGLQVLDSSMSLELGFWIPIVSEIPDSLSCIPDSKVQGSGFHAQNLSGFLFQQRDDFETIADPILP